MVPALRSQLQRALLQNAELSNEVAEQRVSMLLQQSHLRAVSPPPSPQRAGDEQGARSAPGAARYIDDITDPGNALGPQEEEGAAEGQGSGSEDDDEFADMLSMLAQRSA